MVWEIGVTSHRNHAVRIGLAADGKVKMVRLEGATSNTLFTELEQWESYLKGEKLYVHILGEWASLNVKEPKNPPDNEGPIESAPIKSRSPASRLRGPSR